MTAVLHDLAEDVFDGSMETTLQYDSDDDALMNLDDLSYPTTVTDTEGHIILEDERRELTVDDDKASEGEVSSEDDSETDVRDEAIGRVEGLVLSFLSQLSTSLLSDDDDDEATQTRPSQKRHSSRKKIELKLADRKKVMQDGLRAPRTISFPQKGRSTSSRTLAQLLRVTDLTHEALVDDIPTTKRDMYYKDVPLFKSQTVVNRLVDDMAATFEIGRADMNVRAASKGLFAGENLVIHLQDGAEIRGNDSEGMLIPAAEEISHFEVKDHITWVLIVEKEAIFQTLCRYKFASHASLPGEGVIITGKGYPDVATRQLVKTLSDNLPTHVPMLALVDGDAYGLDILSVYKFGSASMRHENEKLAASRLEWLGIWSSELLELGVDRDALIPITTHDEKKALAILRRPEEILPKRWRREMLHMLHLRRKAEIEVLSTSATKTTMPALVAYLCRKISEAVLVLADLS